MFTRLFAIIIPFLRDIPARSLYGIRGGCVPEAAFEELHQRGTALSEAAQKLKDALRNHCSRFVREDCRPRIYFARQPVDLERQLREIEDCLQEIERISQPFVKRLRESLPEVR